MRPLKQEYRGVTKQQQHTNRNNTHIQKEERTVRGRAQHWQMHNIWKHFYNFTEIKGKMHRRSSALTHAKNALLHFFFSHFLTQFDIPLFSHSSLTTVCKCIFKRKKTCAVCTAKCLIAAYVCTSSLLIMCSGSLFPSFHSTERVTVNKTRKESVLALGNFCPSKVCHYSSSIFTCCSFNKV